MTTLYTTVQRNKFLNLLPKDRIDPVAKFDAAFKAIQQNFYCGNYQLRSGQKELEVVRGAVSFLLHRAEALNRLQFWDDLEFSEDLPEEAETGRSERWKDIRENLEVLERESITQHDLLKAMDTVDSVLARLRFRFKVGRLPNGFDGVTENERYLCAALLDPLADLAEQVWRPIRARILQKSRRRASK